MRKAIHTLFVLVIVLTACNNKDEQRKKEMGNTNRLIDETSPYLLEHAHNPVDWYPWGDEALDKAKSENKPIIVSIGYAACHWCHVMEGESFSDSEVAKLMNEKFVCIKVDREERPDIDNLYMNAALMINGRGGWPLNAIALPDGRPFFVGTYFPKEDWMRLLEQISNMYANNYDKILTNAVAVENGLKEQVGDLVSQPKRKDWDYANLYDTVDGKLDSEYGGMRGAPKFPMPSVWDFLQQYSYLQGSQPAYDNVVLTLETMGTSGTYDQLGGGFHRYATDMAWKIPHFEKMLYDNAQLLTTYSNAYKADKNEFYEQIVSGTVEFAERELMSDEGGFYSSLNADSEGEEGKFYVWEYDKIYKLLSKDEFDLLESYYGLTEEGNWEDGKNILHSNWTLSEFSEHNDLDSDKVTEAMQSAHRKLMAHRDTRVRPSTDDKIITSWNAMMISGLVTAYTAFGDEKYMQLALRNAEFIKTKLIHDNGNLHRSYKNGESKINGFLDDYALLSRAYLDLYQSTFDKKWLDLSEQLIGQIMSNFLDEESGFYKYKSTKDTPLAAETMELQDNVIPASNSVVAHLLFDLGHILYNDDYIRKAENMAATMLSSVERSPSFHSNWAKLIGKLQHGIYEVAIMGSDARKLAHQMQSHYLPNALFLGGTEENLPLLKGKQPEGTMIYVCKDKVCNMPVESVEEALKQF
ncbi:MAG: thioredoxin domain-containing protein [Chlorobiota bacterium]